MKKYPYIKAFNYKPGVGLLYFKDIEERCHEEAIIESAPHAIQHIRDKILEAHKMRLDLVRYGGESK